MLAKSDRKTPVVLLTGFAGRPMTAMTALAAALGAQPGTVVVHHDLAELREGVVRRTVTTAGSTTTTILELAHGCVSCTLRADLLPLLCKLATRGHIRRIVLLLDPAIEAEALCHAIDTVEVDGVADRVDGPAGRNVAIEATVAFLDGTTWLADATGDEALADRGVAVADDERTVAQVALGQAEFADALVVLGADVDPLDHARTDAVLSRLNPSVPIAWRADMTDFDAVEFGVLLAGLPADARRGQRFDAHAPLLRGQPPLTVEHGVSVFEFAARRPFHPERLHDALDVLFDGVVTARGRMWLATQPDHVLWLESAGGGLRVGHAGRWLAAMDEDERADVADERAAMAALRWDDTAGDREVSLVILAHDADPAEIRHALHWALVEDDELRLVETAPDEVARWTDPFGEWHEDPCVDDPTTVQAVVDPGKKEG
ncbi:ribosome hibernation factor-recruiting GTPase MRF [Nocardia camponoti]|uniref:Cobalamin synthesis protein n=1 Tax=Nocardia camponoti TaxID=1616106 RepID=A0A917QGZ5_9NOCA|nr:GTP-binding protein [Nocardia camponoti]GGK49411.1 putative cobalamin synthesis protein [Nocardia camponoti]